MNRKSLFIVFLILAGLDILVFVFIVFRPAAFSEKALYFIDVGQGDSQMIALPNDVQIIIDGGPDAKVLNGLTKILPLKDRYIDIVIATHPQLDHIGGLVYILNTYDVGLVVTNGRRADSAVYRNFEKIIRDKKIPAVALKEGDKIKYGRSVLNILSPPKNNASGSDPNDLAIVALLRNPEISALYTSDAGFLTEEYIRRKYNLAVDVLKVGHHGSKYSSGAVFLKEVRPSISIIEVGKNNYGHPTEEALKRLRDIGSRIYTTLEHGTIKLLPTADGIKVLGNR